MKLHSTLLYGIFSFLVPIFNSVEVQAALITKPYIVPHVWKLQLPAGIPQQYKYSEVWRLEASSKIVTAPTHSVPNNSQAGPFLIPPARNDAPSAISDVYKPKAFADANCQFMPGAPLGGSALGSMFAFGSANIDPDIGGQGATSFSACNQGVQFMATDRRGRVIWDPRGILWDKPISKGVSIGTTGIIRDPLSISAIDLDTNDVIESELISVVFELPIMSFMEIDGSGVLHVDSPEGAGTISIKIDSPLITSGQGNLFVSFSDGSIITSEDSGVFDSLAPAVGTPSSFMIDLGSDAFTVDFDLGRDSNNGFDYTFSFGNGASVNLVPGPISFLGLGTAFAYSRRIRRILRKYQN